MLVRALTFFCAWFTLLTLAASPAMAQDVSPTGRSTNVEITLKSARSSVMPGETFFVALEQRIASGWHTYWRNPGDSGEPTFISWTLPKGVEASPIKWPAPTAIPFGPLVNYGFSEQVILPVEIKVPASAKAGEILDLIADVRWLECADICIPGQAKVAIKVAIAAAATDSPEASLIRASVAALPAPYEGTASLTDLGVGGLQLILKGIEIDTTAYFFPHEIKTGAIVDSAQPQELVRSKDGYGLSLVKSPSFPPDLKGPVDGVLVVGKGRDAKSYQVAAAFEATPAGALPLASSEPPENTVPPSGGSIGLWLALIMALAGGLILNLMPCVFPILSMKALGLIEASYSDGKAARAHGLWYGGGVIISFLALAGGLIALKSAGIAAGWGFQLQNPAIVVGLAILMVMIGFNLLGFFEIGGALQNIGGSASHTQGAHGSFLTGILAVVVAAPCTAPFMGAALGFAATQAAPISLLIFAALGLGFALPFVGLTFMPSLLRALPKPGPWMVRLREALAFPMFATAIWLIWVASAQAGQAGVLAALVGVLGSGAAVWCLRAWPNAAGKFIAALVGLGSLIWAIQHVQVAGKTDATQQTAAPNAWSEQAVAELQAQGKTVFVNFTADWCVTCKVNEVNVFADSEVRAALSGEKAAYLVADWTRRDDDIAKALTSHGRVGVPLYLVYKPDADTPQILPQILTSKVILDALK
jgi:thiol:disulfide interchange protein/DsbC/DsbD-like thiol-disulfide interchange protein